MWRFIFILVCFPSFLLAMTDDQPRADLYHLPGLNSHFVVLRGLPPKAEPEVADFMPWLMKHVPSPRKVIVADMKYAPQFAQDNWWGKLSARAHQSFFRLHDEEDFWRGLHYVEALDYLLGADVPVDKKMTYDHHRRRQAWNSVLYDHLLQETQHQAIRSQLLSATIGDGPFLGKSLIRAIDDFATHCDDDEFVDTPSCVEAAKTLNGWFKNITLMFLRQTSEVRENLKYNLARGQIVIVTSEEYFQRFSIEPWQGEFLPELVDTLELSVKSGTCDIFKTPHPKSR